MARPPPAAGRHRAHRRDDLLDGRIVDPGALVRPLGRQPLRRAGFAGPGSGRHLRAGPRRRRHAWLVGSRRSRSPGSRWASPTRRSRYRPARGAGRRPGPGVRGAPLSDVLGTALGTGLGGGAPCRGCAGRGARPGSRWLRRCGRCGRSALLGGLLACACRGSVARSPTRPGVAHRRRIAPPAARSRAPHGCGRLRGRPARAPTANGTRVDPLGGHHPDVRRGRCARDPRDPRLPQARASSSTTSRRS